MVPISNDMGGVIKSPLTLDSAPSGGGKGDFQTPASDADGRQFDTVVTGHRAPGKPEMQANGRGDIDLVGYIRVLHENGYTGPLNLEVIGAKEYALEQCCTIAAESRGHMQACLQACAAR